MYMTLIMAELLHRKYSKSAESQGVMVALLTSPAAAGTC